MSKIRSSIKQLGNGNRLLCADEVANLLGVKTCTIRAWTSQGTIPSVKLPGGRAVRYLRNDIEQLIEDGRREAREEVPQ